MFSGRTTPPRVLVVDGSNLMRAWLLSGLRRIGFPVVDTAADGLEALEKLHGPRPDLVLTDYEMPGMSGAGLVSCIRKDDRLCDLPVVLVTNEDFAARNWKELGFSQCLGKPFSLRRMETAIRNVLFGQPPRKRVGFSWRVTPYRDRDVQIAV